MLTQYVSTAESLMPHNMCVTADRLILTQYVWYSRQFKADTIRQYSRQFNVDAICVVQKTVYCSHNMCGRAESLMLTQYVWYSRQFNVDTINVVQQTV